MRTILHVSSRWAQRALHTALVARGHEVLEEAEEDAPLWSAPTRPDLLIVEVPAGHEGAARCRRLRDRADGDGTAPASAPYVLAVVAPGGGGDALEAGADNFITGVDGELDAHIALAEQAIERRRLRADAEASLAERMWELSVVADHEQDYIAILRPDAGFRYVFVNRALASAVGIPPDSFAGLSTEELHLPFDEAASWERRLSTVAATGVQSTFTFEYHDAAGRRRHSASIVPEPDDADRVAELLVIISDVTERPLDDAPQPAPRVSRPARVPAVASANGGS